MSVEVRRISSRRQVHFDLLEDMLADARALVAADSEGRVHHLGNLTLGQALEHLARWLDASIDGVPGERPPVLLKYGARLLKDMLLNRPLPPGYKLKPQAEAHFVPPPTTKPADGLAHLERAVQRLRSTDQRAESPMLGRLSAADWDRLHLRHAELHLSFMRLADGPGS